MSDHDPVNHPQHYSGHPSGIEPWRITGEMWCPNLATTMKYLVRYPHKHPDKPWEDVEKAAKYVEFEIHRRADIANFTLPSARDLRYERRYEPFYLYAAAEPDRALADKLIELWDVDKDSNPGHLRQLGLLYNWLTNLADELRSRAEQAPRRIRRQQRQAVNHWRSYMAEPDGSYPAWDSWEIYIDRELAPELTEDDYGWYQIEDYFVQHGQKVTVKLAGFPVEGAELTLYPRTQVTLRRFVDAE